MTKPQIDQVVTALDSVQLAPNTAVLTDACNTLFRSNSPELYEDSQCFLASENLGYLALVSAHPDITLARQRAETVVAQDVVIPVRARWMKRGLYREALSSLAGRPIENIVILGDRFLQDVIVGRRQADRMYGNSPQIRSIRGILVRRPDHEVQKQPVDRYLNWVEQVGHFALTAIRQDEFFRPRPAA